MTVCGVHAMTVCGVHAGHWAWGMGHGAWGMGHGVGLLTERLESEGVDGDRGERATGLEKPRDTGLI